MVEVPENTEELKEVCKKFVESVDELLDSIARAIGDSELNAINAVFFLFLQAPVLELIIGPAYGLCKDVLKGDADESGNA